MKNIIENNRLIAEFMGKNYECPQVNGFTPAGDYNSSWDWLMPVIEKIEELENSRYDFHITQYESYIFDREIDVEIITADGKTKIESAYKVVLKFIKKTKS